MKYCRVVGKMKKSIIGGVALLFILGIAVLSYSYETPDIQKIQSKLEQAPRENYIYIENATLYALQNTSAGVERITAYHLVSLEKYGGRYRFNGSVKYYVNGIYRYGYSIYFELFGNSISGYVNVNGTLYDIKDREWEKAVGITREDLIQREIYSSFRLGVLKTLLSKSKLQLKQGSIFSSVYKFEGAYKKSKVEFTTDRGVSKILVSIQTPYGSKIHKELIFLEKA